MTEILYRLQALYQFYKSAHWLAKGELFYQDHKLFERLYEGFDDEMDTLVELLLATEGEDKEFEPALIMKEATKFIPNFGDTKANMKSAAKAEEELLQIIQEIDDKDVSVGLFNHLAAIAQAHTSKGYLLHRALLK